MSAFIFGRPKAAETPFSFSSPKILNVGPDGRTALHIAALQGDVMVVTELLHCGADINAVDAMGMRALHAVAAADGDMAGVCEFLLGEGTDIDATDHGGNTALHHAAAAGGVETVRVLLDRGAKRLLNGRGELPERCAVGGVVTLLKELEGKEEDGGWWQRVLRSFGGGGGGGECVGGWGLGPCGEFDGGDGCEFCGKFYIGGIKEAVEEKIEVDEDEVEVDTGEIEVDVEEIEVDAEEMDVDEEAGIRSGKRKWEGGSGV